MKKTAVVIMLLTILALTFVSLASTRVMASVPKPLTVRLESKQDNDATSRARMYPQFPFFLSRSLLLIWHRPV